ncbi:MAG: FAD-binding protein [Clostridiales Family XIII bacterium]|nr:FAD-binding protein [Clostridiales Family XIII bacterium]
MKQTKYTADVLVVGGGIAGCFAAIKARENGASVILADKGYVGKSGQTPQTNTFAIFDPKIHDIKNYMYVANTTGDYMNDRDWSEIVFKNSWARWQELVSWGITIYKWDRHGVPYESAAAEDDGGEPVKMPLNPYGMGTKQHMQSVRHPVRKHAEIMRRQAEKVGVTIMDRVCIVELLKQDGRCAGAVGISPDSGDALIFLTKATVLCSGPAGLKSPGLRCMCTGDSDAMGYRAGCTITGKEWEETHPVRSDFPAWPWAAKDRDRLRTFMTERKMNTPTYNALDEMVGLHWSRLATHHLEAFQAFEGKAPTVWETTSGMSEFQEMHHSPKGYPRSEFDDYLEKRGRVRMVMGRAVGQSSHVADGIWPVNKQCESEIPGLYSAGDSLGARAAGAEYPGQGFATCYSSVTGAIAGEAAAKLSKETETPEVGEQELQRALNYVFAPYDQVGGFSPAWATQVMQATLFPYWVLYVKSEERLQTALKQIEYMQRDVIPKLTARDFHELRLAHETRNMALNAEMKLKASLLRKESRGAHFREDYPKRIDPYGLKWIKIKQENGEMKFFDEPVPEKWWPDLTLPYEKRYIRRFPIKLNGEQAEGVEA